MDVCFTSASASPLHIAATYGAEALLPTPPCTQILHSDLFDSDDSTMKILCFQNSFLALLITLSSGHLCLSFMGHCLLLKARSQCL